MEILIIPKVFTSSVASMLSGELKKFLNVSISEVVVDTMINNNRKIAQKN